MVPPRRGEEPAAAPRDEASPSLRWPPAKLLQSAPLSAARIRNLVEEIAQSAAEAPDRASRRWIMAEGVRTLRQLVGAYEIEFGPVPPVEQGLPHRELGPVFRAMIRSADTVIAQADPTEDSFYELRLLQVRMLALLGQDEEALRRVDELAAMVKAIQSHDLREDVVGLNMTMCLKHGRLDQGARPLLRLLAERRVRRPLTRRFLLELGLIGRARGLLAPMGLGASCRIARVWTTIARLRPRRYFGRGSALLLSRHAKRVFKREAVIQRVPGDVAKAIRAMGGLGDLLMMTPGLRALARLSGHKVEFAVPSRFAPLFAGNPDIVMLPIETLSADWARSDAVVDLTDCPGTAGETATAPNITVNRIELFARAMGVTDAQLAQIGTRPVFEPTPQSREAARAWLAQRGLAPGSFAVVQAMPMERYRHYRRMSEVAQGAAALLPVVAFHDRELPGYDAPGIFTAFDLDLPLSLAVACEARMMIAPDSSFLHLAGARDIPCVLISGPTDGALRAGSYPRTTVVSMKETFRCMPCWRNASMPCQVTGGPDSVCLDLLPVERVMQAVRDCLTLATRPA